MASYTLEYVYDLDDFLTSGDNITPPNEQSARAAGDPPFTITLDASATSQEIAVDDSDNGVFNEIAAEGQTLEEPVTLSGVTYPIGSSILINYTLTTDDGFQLMSITIGTGNSANNTTTAVITSSYMVPGQTYVFTSESNIGNKSVDYSEFACFTKGTFIMTPTGNRLIEELRCGDLVNTLDSGRQPIRWIGDRQLPAVGKMAPIVFSKNAYGNGRELVVSPNHRMLFTGYKAELLFGQSEILVAAKHLVNGDTIFRKPGGYVHYFHMLFDNHEIVTANNALSESYFIGDNFNESTTKAQRDEILTIFPELRHQPKNYGSLARMEAKAFETLLLA
ncbi:hypothetical protein RB2150_01859 [Rhodobacteraceae bacterium HTCC2150]|nr:hypothetical protein RB2150_01859 [Rhodobacteraceae bacterium HTCC2150]